MKLKKGIKLTVLLLTSACMLTACKDNKHVNYNTETTATSGEILSTETDATASLNDWEVPERLEETITGERRDVKIYADITVPDAYKKCSVVELVRDDFTDEDIVDMAEKIFDSGSYFLCMPSNPCTPEYFNEVYPKLLQMRDSLPDEGDALYYINQDIGIYERYQQEPSEYDNLEETDGTIRFYTEKNGEYVDKECCVIIGTIDGEYYSLNFEKSKGACYAWLFKYGMLEATEEVGSENISVQQLGNTCIYSEEEAIEIATEYVEKLGYENMVPVHVNHVVRKEDVNGYSVYFGRAYENYHLTYTTENFTINRYSYITNEEADNYVGYTNMECIRIEVGDDGVREFEISSPMQQGEILTENAVLLPWEQVHKVATETLVKAADDDSKVFVIELIELGYGIEKKDNKVALVPVWYYFDINAVDDSGYRYTKTSVMEINALDGSIIKSPSEE